jgi:FHS family L-fucose permease-like MFS transporter
MIFKYFVGAEYTGADSVKIPYLIFATIFVLLAIFFKIIHLPVFTNHDVVSKGLGVLKHKPLRYGMGAIFMYVGAEVCIGSILISYLKLKEVAGLDDNHASTFVAFYWGGLMIGRFIGGISLSTFKNNTLKWALILVSAITTTLLIMSIAHYKNGISFMEMSPYAGFVVLQILGFILGRNKPARTLLVFSIVIITLLLVTMTNIGVVAMWAVIAAGLFNSIMWSNIFTLAIKDLGEKTSQGSSLLIMMVVGGALLPLFQGYLADRIGIQMSFIVPLVGYAYISFYSIWGYKNFPKKIRA